MVTQVLPDSGVTWVMVSLEPGLVLKNQNCWAAVGSEDLGLRCPRNCSKWFLLHRVLKRCSEKQTKHVLALPLEQTLSFFTALNSQ